MYCICMCMLERCIIHVHGDAEGRKKEASKVIQTTKQHIHFPKENSFSLVGFDPRHSALDRALYHVPPFLDVNHSFVLTYFDFAVIYYDYFSCPLRLIIIFLKAFEDIATILCISWRLSF